MNVKPATPDSTAALDLPDALIAAWRTTTRTTAFLLEQLPASLWPAAVPGAPQRTIRGIFAHLHNARARWIRTLGQEHGVAVPVLVDRHRVTRRDLRTHLRRSGEGIEALLRLGLETGGAVPPSQGYVWQNLPLDVGHVLAYFVAHEAHHRGQIVMVARQLGHRLPIEVTGGLWEWKRRSREAARLHR